MSELELQLVALGRELEFPAPPDLAGAVRARLRTAPERQPHTWARPLAIALAAVAVAVGAAFAVPQARTAILRFFHLRGVTVERVETLPAARERPLASGLGRAMSRAASERVLGFRMLLPPLERGHVPRVYVREEGLGSVLLRRGKRTLLLSEFVSTNFGVLKKAAVGATTVERVSVDGGVGIWITGAPHVLVYLDRDGRFRERPVRVTGSVLLWERGPLTLRLEGDLSKDEAARLARSVR